MNENQIRELIDLICESYEFRIREIMNDRINDEFDAIANAS